MQRPLQLEVGAMPNSEVLKTLIRKNVAKLEESFGDIVGCKVSLQQQQRRKHQGLLFNLRILIAVSGAEIDIARNYNEDAYVALREAFEAAGRKLESHHERKQINYTRMSPRNTAMPQACFPKRGTA